MQKSRRLTAKMSQLTKIRLQYPSYIKATGIFRTVGHQKPDKFQQTRSPSKITLGIRKSYLKVIPFSLGKNNFAGLATALKMNKSHTP